MRLRRSLVEDLLEVLVLLLAKVVDQARRRPAVTQLQGKQSVLVYREAKVILWVGGGSGTHGTINVAGQPRRAGGVVRL